MLSHGRGAIVSRRGSLLGLLRAGRYLPTDVTDLQSDLTDVLRHELADLRRRDALWDTLASYGRWCLCFHPPAHRAYASMRLERELACDAIVIRHSPSQRSQWADTLLRFGWRATLADDPGRLGLAFPSHVAVLKARVVSISRWSNPLQVAKSFRALLGSTTCWGPRDVVCT